MDHSFLEIPQLLKANGGEKYAGGDVALLMEKTQRVYLALVPRTRIYFCVLFYPVQ
jgi:hypothetical protein